MASGSGQVDVDSDTNKKILSQRRCIILAIVGSTPSSNTALQKILQNGFLSDVKSWMNDALNGSIGELVDYVGASFVSNTVACPVAHMHIGSLMLFSSRMQEA